MTDSLPEVFGPIKLHKKASRNISLLKLSWFGCQFSGTALEIDTFYVEYYSVLTKSR